MSQQSGISKNIVANIAGRIWAFLSIFIFVPVYVRLLGVEAYGVITFYSVLLTFLTFADTGFSATLNREFARESPFNKYKANLLVTLEKIYFLLAILITGSTFVFAENISHSFMNAKDIPLEKLVLYVRLMGGTIGLYIFSTLYQSGMMGLQRQVTANALSISYNTMKAGLVVVPLLFKPTLDVYFYWQIVSAAIYLAVTRFYIARALGGIREATTNFSYLRPIWRYTTGMMMLAIIYATNTQVDKLTIGSLLPLSDLGLYFMAASVAQASLMLATPIGMAIFPELSRLVSQSNITRIKEVYGRYSFIIAAITSIVVVVLFAYCFDYVTIWQSDTQIAAYITQTTRILLLGFLFLGLQIMPYYLALANGYTRINVILGLCSIAFIIPTMKLFVVRFGFVGASYSWLIINSLSAMILAGVVISKFLQGEFRNWIFKNTILPIAATITIALPLYWLSTFLAQGYYTLIYGIVIALTASFANLKVFICFYPNIKEKKLYKKFRL